MDSPCEKLLFQAFEIQPDNFEILLNLGIHYGKIGQYENCRRFLLLADAQKPNQPIVQHYLNQLDAVTRQKNPLSP
jgi:Flp pilus assembly protein TadD